MNRLDRWVEYTAIVHLLCLCVLLIAGMVWDEFPAWLGPHPDAVLIATGAAWGLSLVLFAGVAGYGWYVKRNAKEVVR